MLRAGTSHPDNAGLAILTMHTWPGDGVRRGHVPRRGVDRLRRVGRRWCRLCRHELGVRDHLRAGGGGEGGEEHCAKPVLGGCRTSRSAASPARWPLTKPVVPDQGRDAGTRHQHLGLDRHFSALRILSTREDRDAEPSGRTHLRAHEPVQATDQAIAMRVVGAQVSPRTPWGFNSPGDTMWRARDPRLARHVTASASSVRVPRTTARTSGAGSTGQPSRRLSPGCTPSSAPTTVSRSLPERSVATRAIVYWSPRWRRWRRWSAPTPRPQPRRPGDAAPRPVPTARWTPWLPEQGLRILSVCQAAHPGPAGRRWDLPPSTPAVRRGTPRARRAVPAHRWSGHRPRRGCRRRSGGQPALPAADPAGPRRHAGRGGQRLHGAEPEAGEQDDSVRQHVVRLARPDPRVRTAHHADTGPLHPDDVGPALLKSKRIGGRQRRPPGSQASVAPTKAPAAASRSTVSTSSSAPSAVRKVACSTPATPAATDSAMPRGPCACAVTASPKPRAASHAARSSTGPYCDSCTPKPGVINPPVAMILMMSTPAATRCATAARTPSTPSAAPPRNQQCPPVRVIGGPDISSSGPPVQPLRTRPVR